MRSNTPAAPAEPAGAVRLTAAALLTSSGGKQVRETMAKPAVIGRSRRWSRKSRRHHTNDTQNKKSQLTVTHCSPRWLAPTHTPPGGWLQYRTRAEARQDERCPQGSRLSLNSPSKLSIYSHLTPVNLLHPLFYQLKKYLVADKPLICCGNLKQCSFCIYCQVFIWNTMKMRGDVNFTFTLHLQRTPRPGVAKLRPGGLMQPVARGTC